MIFEKRPCHSLSVFDSSTFPDEVTKEGEYYTIVRFRSDLGLIVNYTHPSG